MSSLNYLVIEYWPHAMDGTDLRPCRVDGHYRNRADAEAVAALWAENPHNRESRIVVVEILHEAQRPAHWKDAPK